MKEFSFQALGTQWTILVDEETLTAYDTEALFQKLKTFEEHFSRFLPGSEVNQFREAKAGRYTISEEFTRLLEVADQLRKLTAGRYDPAVGGLLEHAGYDPAYRMVPDEQAMTYQLPQWSLEGRELTIDGPVIFDLGGIGKGYAIDLVAKTLQEQGHHFFLVDGGGDMYGTTKRDGSVFRVALEWPGKPDTAFGVVELRHQGLAVSDSFKRRWKEWHHILDPQSKKPIAEILGCAALAKSAFAADCMTSALFLSSPEQYGAVAQTFKAEYVVFRKDEAVSVSAAWPGELF